jgi:NADH-quinone oxidoreductase subunit J
MSIAPILAAAPTYLPQQIAFGLIAVTMIVAAIRVVTTRNVVHAALWLILVLAGVAAQFIVLASEFVAVTQVLVYIGAIVVLFLFGVMLTRAPIGKEVELDNERAQKITGAVVALFLLACMGYVLADYFKDRKLALNGKAVGQLGGTTAQISDSIFSTYLVPFEVVSVLLLAALIGAIVLARRD